MSEGSERSLTQSLQHKAQCCAHRLRTGTAAFPRQRVPTARWKVGRCPGLLSLDLENSHDSSKIPGDFQKCLQSRSHITKLPDPQKILEGEVDRTLKTTISPSSNNLLHFLLWKKVFHPSTTSQPTPKKIRKISSTFTCNILNNQEIKGKKEQKGGKEGGCHLPYYSAGMGFLIAPLSSTKPIYAQSQSTFQYARNDFPVRRERRRAIANNHSTAITLDNSQTFLLSAKVTFQKKGKATELWPQIQLGYTASIAQGHRGVEK